jgi:hypothetical protein
VEQFRELGGYAAARYSFYEFLCAAKVQEYVEKVARILREDFAKSGYKPIMKYRPLIFLSIFLVRH